MSDDEWSLYSNRHGFADSLDQIVRHIRSADSATSLTFAVYGRWGSGKSTALKYLERSLAPDAQAGRITICRFDAPRWQLYPNVRAGLAYEIMRGAAPQLLDKITRSMLEVSGTKADEYDKSQQRLGTATKFLESFSASMSVPPALEDWLQDQLIGGLSETEGESPRAHVVFIDDLDRCEYDYNARLLAATNYWAGRAGFTVFFIIAASRDHVVRSLASQDSLTAALSGVALEKYVHVAIEMPNLLITRTEIANFVGSLFGQIHERMRSSLETMLLRSAEKYPDSVLAPLLQDGGNSCTPRAVKSRFNTFQTEVRPQSPQRS
ncbi:MAG: P-loop NTPase fold protein [Pseudonocardiaceae bacterium]